MKPELILIPNPPTIDDIVAMFEKISGRKVTPEDRREAEKILATGLGGELAGQSRDD
jgi:hypothetical protein